MKAERSFERANKQPFNTGFLIQRGVFLPQVHSERPTPQMETERRAMLLVGLIIEAYLNADGGEDWRFCLAASQLLVEIVKNNVTKGSIAEIQSWGAYHLSGLADPISQFANAKHRCCRFESCL